MSDFHQRGLIGTLHRLRQRPIGDLEQELAGPAAAQPVGLILPCTLEDFHGAAMGEILQEVRQARYLSAIVVSVNRADVSQMRIARGMLPDDPRFRLIWNDDPAWRTLVPGLVGGKGFNLWAALGCLMAGNTCRVIICHDTDIQGYSREIPALLALPLLMPGWDYHFVKGYYPRVAGQLFGRVTRLFVDPLLRSLVRVAGHQPLLDFLDGFRYPLAGECGGRIDMLEHFTFRQGWELEMDMLCSVHRHARPEAVAQVDLGHNYAHKHQPLMPGHPHTGLVRLAAEIGGCLLGQLEREGTAVTPAFLQALRSAYEKSAKEMIRRYRDVALINGIAFDEGREMALVTEFAAVLPVHWPTGIAQPADLPSWGEMRKKEPSLWNQAMDIWERQARI